MILNTLPPGCLVAAQNTRVLYAFMNCSFVLIKIALQSCLSHIARKGTSPLHELLFCVYQDHPWKLLYGQIACKGTSSLHEVIFCVEQDDPLKLPKRVLHPFMNCSFQLRSPLEAA